MEWVTPGSAGRVLICDDTVNVRQLMRINLELDGFDVEETDDGAALLTSLIEHASREELPDVVVLDSQMHPHDGWWAIEAIRTNPALADVPVIMVTASLQHHDREQARAAGLDAFVGKPFDPDHLVSLVLGFRHHGRAFASQDRP